MLCPSCHTGNRDDAKFCKGCGKPLQPLQGSLSHVQQQVEQVEDPALEPTLIISPEKMMAYHQRHWEEAMAQDAAPEPYAYASSIGIRLGRGILCHRFLPMPLMVSHHLLRRNDEQEEDRH